MAFVRHDSFGIPSFDFAAMDDALGYGFTDQAMAAVWDAVGAAHDLEAIESAADSAWLCDYFQRISGINTKFNRRNSVPQAFHSLR